MEKSVKKPKVSLHAHKSHAPNKANGVKSVSSSRNSSILTTMNAKSTPVNSKKKSSVTVGEKL